MEEMIDSFPPTYDLLKKGLLSKLKQIEDSYVLSDYSVTWGVEDFKYRAEHIEGENWREVYDESLFNEVCIQMIDEHDATIGISWDSIDVYLNDHCKIID
jgi:hypothetical protein